MLRDARAKGASDHAAVLVQHGGVVFEATLHFGGAPPTHLYIGTRPKLSVAAEARALAGVTKRKL